MMKICRALAHMLAVPALGMTMSPAFALSATTFSAAQLLDYAHALVEVKRIQNIVAAKKAKLPPTGQQALVRQADVQMLLALQRHGLDPARFNAISRAVENRADIRLQVQQAMMADVVGFGPA